MRMIGKNIKKNFGKEQFQFVKHSKNYLIGNFSAKALSFISIPIFTRLLLPEEYGLIAIVNSITQIMIILMLLNFHGALARNYHENDNDFSNFFGSITVFLILYNIVFLIAIFILRNEISSFYKINPTLLLLAAINSFTGMFTTLYLSYLQTSQNSKKYALINFIKSFLILLISIIWVLCLKQNKYLGRIYSTLLINVILSVYSIYNIHKISTYRLNFSKIKYAINFGVPLIPHAMSGFLLTQFDRIIINQINGSLDAGLYSFAYNVGMLMNVVVISLNKSWVPIFYAKLKEKKYKDIEKLVISYTKIILIIALGLILFSKEIVLIIADAKYYSALNLVPVIVMSYVFVYFYTIYANYAFYRKKTYLISINTIIAATVNIIMNYVFIPKFGYIAGAYTTLFSYALLCVLHYINAKYIIKEKIPRINSFVVSVVIFAALLCIYKFIEQYDVSIIFEMISKIALIGIYLWFILSSSKQQIFKRR